MHVWPEDRRDKFSLFCRRGILLYLSWQCTTPRIPVLDVLCEKAKSECERFTKKFRFLAISECFYQEILESFHDSDGNLSNEIEDLEEYQVQASLASYCSSVAPLVLN